LSDFPGLVSKRSARTFYNVADALRPPEAGHAGAGDVDLVPALTAHLRWQGVGAARRFFCILFLIEWLPALGSGRGRRFWRLPRAERQRHLERWRSSRLRLRRESLEWLEALVDEARSDAAASD
jgi:hypothetical protein